MDLDVSHPNGSLLAAIAAIEVKGQPSPVMEDGRVFGKMGPLTR